jgi:hypothetical protein
VDAPRKIKTIVISNPVVLFGVPNFTANNNNQDDDTNVSAKDYNLLVHTGRDDCECNDCYFKEMLAQEHDDEDDYEDDGPMYHGLQIPLRTNPESDTEGIDPVEHILSAIHAADDYDRKHEDYSVCDDDDDF